MSEFKAVELYGETDAYIDTINYNHLSVPIYRTNTFYYTIIAGKKVKLCETSCNYRDFVFNQIDKYTGLLADFGNNCYLCYFDNAGHRDLKVVYKNRIVKIFITETNEISPDTENKIVREAAEIISKLDKKGI